MMTLERERESAIMVNNLIMNAIRFIYWLITKKAIHAGRIKNPHTAQHSSHEQNLKKKPKRAHHSHKVHTYAT